LGLSAPEPSRPATAPKQTKAKPIPGQNDTSNDNDEDDTKYEQDKGDVAEDGYEFNLFSTSGPAAKVILEDTELQGDGGFEHPRPHSFYITKDLSAKEKAQYEYAAVGADEIIAWSKQPSWGMEMPWKVRELKVTRKAKPGDTCQHILQEIKDDKGTGGKKRPGKKQRILVRQRTQAKAQKAEEAVKHKLEKEEHLKDKKKRLNRIKKLRKRAKDKEKKLAAGGDEAADDSDASGDESAAGE
jgi:hypothetical protein